MPALRSSVLALERQLPAMSQKDLPGVLAATRLMIRACIGPGTGNASALRGPLETTLLERARQLIQNDLLSPLLSPDRLCRELNVSRSRLYRTFSPLGGIAAYIRTRRLLDAHAALSNPEDIRPISDIAGERGFMDPADFSRAFHREFGYRPSEARHRSYALPLKERDKNQSAPISLVEMLRRLA